MHIEFELDDSHAELLLLQQQQSNTPVSEIIADIVAKAIDALPHRETEGQKVLRILEQHKLLGCMEGDGNLSVDYKKHLWNQQ